VLAITPRWFNRLGNYIRQKMRLSMGEIGKITITP
jgi:hypothetical protein